MVVKNKEINVSYEAEILQLKNKIEENVESKITTKIGEILEETDC